MFTPKFETPASHAVSAHGVAALNGSSSATETTAVAQPELGQPDSLRSAHEAVEVVLHAVEHVAAREQKSVNLKFSVGETELSVRVELHANEVRTTFRTDSSELRSALAQEWNQLSSSAPDRTARVAQAIFTPADSSAFNSAAGDSSSRHRQSDTPQTEGERLTAVTRSRRPASASAAQPPTAEAAPVVSRSSRRLQAHA